MRKDHTLLILGASTRAAAWSAIRAGLKPVCADLFADADLRACARVLDVTDYPRGLVAAAGQAPDCPWMYTGGLENRPGLVAQVSKSRPLWGNDSDVLRRVRNPWNVRRLLVEAGLPLLAVWPPSGAPPAADGRWMRKPIHGAAGRGTCVWDRASSDRGGLHEPHYFQERSSGDPVSALYLGTREKTLLLGITRQLIGLTEVDAQSFAWCGTIAPLDLPDDSTATIRQIGDCLKRGTGLMGLFGCDFLVEEGVPWLTEVNPRYPASVELIECALGIPILDLHRRAFEGPFGESLSARPVTSSTSRAVLGKIVLYANREIVVPDLTRFIFRPQDWLAGDSAPGIALPYMADIPLPGTHIARGHPICTLFARAGNEADCRVKLLRRAARFKVRLALS